MGGETIEPETNMVYASLPDAAGLVQHLENDGIKTLAVDSNTIRLVPHLDVNDACIQALLTSLEKWLN